MKTILLNILILIPVLLCAQSSGSYKSTDVYVFNNKKDTISFSDLGFKPSPFYKKQMHKLIDSVQVDGSGAKELIFYRTLSGRRSEHGGTFDIDENWLINLYEVWNADSAKMLFRAASFYQYDFNSSQAYAYPNNKKGRVDYYCAFKIDSTGMITINHFKINEATINDTKWVFTEKAGVKEIALEGTVSNLGSTTPIPFIPMWPPATNGTYMFKEGKYIKQ